MSVNELAADGSAAKDARPAVRIDRSQASVRYRYLCPNGHIDWSPTNNHLWCKGCRRRYEAGDEDVDAEHYHVVDKKTGEKIGWERVELV